MPCTFLVLGVSVTLGTKLELVIDANLIFVTNITNYIRREKIVMWRNVNFPCMAIVGKLKISPHVEKVKYN